MGFMLICNGTLNGILSGTSGTISFRILFHISFWIFMNKHSGFYPEKCGFCWKTMKLLYVEQVDLGGTMDQGPWINCKNGGDT